jgi:hypothetical protein
MKASRSSYTALSWLIVAALCFPIPTRAQKKFHVKIVSLTGHVVKGTLVRAGKDSIIVSGKNHTTIAFHIRDVASVGVRRKGAIGRGAGYGALIGATTGALLALGTHCTTYCLSKEQSALFGAMLIGTAGAVIGTAVNLGHRRFDLQKSPQQMNDFLWRVEN